jgi:hypothetical protein
MDDGVGERFGQRQFDIVFAARGAPVVAHHIHDASHHLIDRVAVGAQRYTQFQFQFRRIEMGWRL